MGATITIVIAAAGQFLDGDSPMLLACLALAAATIVFIFYIEPDASDSAPHRTRLDQLLDRRDTIYENLRDLKFEYRAGKFSEKDFEDTRTALEAEAALVLAQIEEVTGGVVSPAARRAPAEAPSTARAVW